jgi:hypothetical protein
MSSSSVSTSYLPPEFNDPFKTQVDYAKIQADLEQRMLDLWEKTYQENSGLTSDIVGKYLANTARAQNMSLNDLSRYENLFQPQENNLVQEANSYASVPRQQFEMGRAEATTANAANAARMNTLNELRSYGVNPSAGEFAALTSAANTQAAAAQAAAGTQAAQQTAATGRQLRGQAIQIGQAYPSQVLGEINAAESGLSGAMNSKLANTQTGANILGTPQTYGGLAMGLRYPPLGHSSSSMSTKDGNKGSNSSGRGDTSAGEGGGFAGDPAESSSAADPNWAGTGPLGSGGAPGGGGYPGGQPMSEVLSASQGSGGGLDVGGIEGGAGGGMTNPFPSDNSFTDQSDFGQGSDTSDFAGGGEVGLRLGGGPTTGGDVPYSASPSRGGQTDDIPARLNAGEFVMPRDATAYYGHKHLTSMIQKARAAMGQPQQPIGAKMKPSLGGRPAFVSRGYSTLRPGLDLGGQI